MKTQAAVALAGAVLLAGVLGASAVSMRSGPTPAAKTAPRASDTLNLTDAQQRTAWEDLYLGFLNQAAPAGFKVSVGAVLPHSVATAPMTKKAAGEIPALQPYHFAMVQKKLVIVNPNDRKIAEVISR